MPFKKKTTLPRNAARTSGQTKARARQSDYAVAPGGSLTLLKRTLEYASEGAPAKQPRMDSPADMHDSPHPTPTDTPLSSTDVEHDEGLAFSALSTEEMSLHETSTPTEFTAPNLDSPHGPQSTHSHANAKKTPSARINAFIPHFEQIISDMFWKDYNDDISGPCSTAGCPNPCTATCRECRALKPSCHPCMLTRHRNLPWHWISVWNGDFFERRDLRDLGHVIYLGHHGDPCPHIPTGDPPIKFVIVHDNGVHSCALQYCHCPTRPTPLSQLIRGDLFPATLDRIETAFTCEVLERFHLDFDVSKRSTQDFVRILEQLSPPDVETGRVKDRYHDFLLAARIYQFCTTSKRAGRRHGIVIPGRDPASLTVPCFTCPIPDFNLPPDWKDVPESLRFLYCMIFCVDGNYSLQKKTKPTDELDIALTTGQGFFVPDEDMRDYLNARYHVKPPASAAAGDDIPIICTAFKVARSQRTAKFRYLDNSGVLSFSCDHLHFRPGATVDLHTTETHGATDRALLAALKGTQALLERGMSYDIICSYICHLRERIAKLDPDYVAIVEELKMLLPKLHMHAHKEMCQIVYAFCYAQGFGLAHGEGVETPWAELNIAGLSTREMTAGARHDALNSLFNYWNWRKTCNMANFLARKLGEAYVTQRRTTRYLASLTGLAGSETVAKWLAIPVDSAAPTPQTFRAKTESYPTSVYMWNRAELPNVETALEEILGGKRSGRTGHKHTAGAQLRNSAAMFIKNGIDLHQELLHLRYARDCRHVHKQPVVHDGFASNVTWQSFHDKLVKWQKAQRKHMPSFDEEYDELQEYEFDLADADADEAFEPCPEGLGLPSDHSAEDRDNLGLQTLAEYELTIRIGLAFDQLDAIRLAVRHRAAYVNHKRKNARGVRANTIAQEEINQAAARARVLAARYNDNFRRVHELRPNDYDRTADLTPGARLQLVNLDMDLAIADITVPRTLHDSQHSGSWIWTVYDKVPVKATRSGGAGDTLQETSVDVVQWHRAKAKKDRADEAVSKLCAEFRRTSTGYRACADLWTKSAHIRGGGERAYALKTASMWRRMAQDCEHAYEAARRPGVPASQLDHTRSLRPYLEQICGEDITKFEDILGTWNMSV